jgi:hypothetical protein
VGQGAWVVGSKATGHELLQICQQCHRFFTALGRFRTGLQTQAGSGTVQVAIAQPLAEQLAGPI